jgi:DNA-binding MarR family transcriptional regulator
MSTASPSSELADRVHSAAIHLLRLLRREDSASEVGAARLSALSVLVFGGPRRLGELAALEQVRPATMSRIAAGLERLGLAVRETDPADGRAQRLRATPLGRKRLLQARRRRVRVLAQRLERLDVEKRAALERGTEVLVELLDRGDGPSRRAPAAGFRRRVPGS